MDSEAFLLKIGFAPGDPDSREALELVLAAAALEVPAKVLFFGPGTAHLQPDHAPAWQQLIDHGLAGVFYAEGDWPAASAPPRLAAVALDAAELATLEQEARQVLVL